MSLAAVVFLYSLSIMIGAINALILSGNIEKNKRYLLPVIFISSSITSFSAIIFVAILFNKLCH